MRQIIAGGGQLTDQLVHRHKLGAVALFQGRHSIVEGLALVVDSAHLLVEAIDAIAQRAITAENVAQQIVQPLGEPVRERDLAAVTGDPAQHFDGDAFRSSLGPGELPSGSSGRIVPQGALHVPTGGSRADAESERGLGAGADRREFDVRGRTVSGRGESELEGGGAEADADRSAGRLQGRIAVDLALQLRDHLGRSEGALRQRDGAGLGAVDLEGKGVVVAVDGERAGGHGGSGIAALGRQLRDGQPVVANFAVAGGTDVVDQRIGGAAGAGEQVGDPLRVGLDGLLQLGAIQCDGAVALGGDAQIGQRIHLGRGAFHHLVQLAADLAEDGADAEIPLQGTALLGFGIVAGQGFDRAGQLVVRLDESVDAAADRAVVFGDGQGGGSGILGLERERDPRNRIGERVVGTGDGQAVDDGAGVLASHGLRHIFAGGSIGQGRVVRQQRQAGHVGVVAVAVGGGDLEAVGGAGGRRTQDQPITAAVVDHAGLNADLGLVDRLGDTAQRVVGSVDGNGLDRLVGIGREGRIGRGSAISSKLEGERSGSDHIGQAVEAVIGGSRQSLTLGQLLHRHAVGADRRTGGGGGGEQLVVAHRGAGAALEGIRVFQTGERRLKLRQGALERAERGNSRLQGSFTLVEPGFDRGALGGHQFRNQAVDIDARTDSR